jgi:hypothetical protein
MGGDFKLEAFGSGVHESVANWATGARRKGRSDTSLRSSLTSWKRTDAAVPGASEVAVARAPNERFGSSRNMLAPAAVFGEDEDDEIVSVVDIDDVDVDRASYG